MAHQIVGQPVEEAQAIEVLAKDAYTTYCGVVGWKAKNGFDLPAWDEFSANPENEIQANGWRAVGKSFLVYGKAIEASIELDRIDGVDTLP